MKTIRIYILLLATVLGTSQVYAQSDPITVEAELSRQRVYVGDKLAYKVLVRGTDQSAIPTIDFPPAVRANYRGINSQSFTSIRIINGRRQRVVDQRDSYQYTLTAMESGVITIPAPVIEINGQQYTGNPVSFESVYPAKSDNDTMVILIDRDEVYLNETVLVECQWWIGSRTFDINFNTSSIPDSFQITGYEPSTPGQQRVSFELNGQQMLGVAEVDPRDPQQRTKFTFLFGITPTKRGTFELGPLRVTFTRTNRADENFRAYAESDPVTITVRDVPIENRPAGYHGAMGAFQLRSQTANTTVNVGDPIKLTLDIGGDEPMVGIDDAPDLQADPRFTDQFKVSSEGWREVLPRKSGKRVYETTIRAVDEHVTQIPPIKLPSFHPTTHAYKVYESNPIDLVVNPVQEITLSDAIVTGSEHSPQPLPEQVDRTELTRAMPGLWAHDSAQALLDSPAFSVRDALKNPVWIAAVGSGPAVFAFSLLFVGARRTADPQARALRKALRQSQSLLHRGGHARAMRVYLASALDINEDAVVAEDAHRLPINKEDADSIARLLAQDEQGGYLGNDQTPKGDQAERAVHAVRAHLLKDVHSQVLRAWRIQS